MKVGNERTRDNEVAKHQVSSGTNQECLGKLESVSAAPFRARRTRKSAFSGAPTT